jgi:hypothetical protein
LGLLFACLIIWGARAWSQNIIVGGHAGALARGAESTIAYGAHVNVNPFGWAAFHVDTTFANFSGGRFYFSTSPAMVYYPVNFDEFRLGVLGGPGFYKISGVDTKFGVHAGLQALFSVIPQFTVGMESRYHALFSSPSVWNVFLTAGYNFDGPGGW